MQVTFDTIAREWRCKWSEADEKASLSAAQTELEKHLITLKNRGGKVQRVVCGSCHDFKVITSLPAAAFGEWEGAQFAPEAEFLAALKEIAGISVVETQTVTLMEM